MLCVTPADVHWIQGTGLPNASTVGRNTLRAGGINNFDVSLSKSFQIGEQKRLEFRWEAFNALNHPQFTQVPERSVAGSRPDVAVPLSESRFHRQRHPQHVGAGEARILIHTEEVCTKK